MKNEDKIVDLLIDMLAENRLTVSEVRLTNTKLDALTDRVSSLEDKFDKQGETLVETLAEQVAMKNQLSQLIDRVGEALDTFYRVLDRNAIYERKFEDIERRLSSIEHKKQA